MNQKWFEDMMSQKYHEDICFNPSKLLLLQFIVNDGTIKDRYKIYDFQTYLYRVYSDNPEISQKHPSYLIRHIEKYGVKDLEDIARDTIESWIRDSKNNILRCGDKYFALNIELSDGSDIAKNTSYLARMMYKKVFGGTIPEIIPINEELVKNDSNLAIFGKSAYKKRILEDMQYCPICEEINSENLLCVHILESSMGANGEQLLDKNNGLILCKQHAQDFLDKKFYFDELGFAQKIEECDIESGMHLSFAIKNSSRKKYLKQRILWLKKQGLI